jgi:hypothetical protein
MADQTALDISFQNGGLTERHKTTFAEFREELGPIDIMPLMNAIVYLAVTSYLGSPLWKSICIAVFVFVATKYHYGRRTLIKAGIILMLVTTPFWLELAPPLSDLAATARTVGTHLVAHVQP